MSVGVLPNVNSVKLNRDAKQGTSVCSRTTRLKNNKVKRRKKNFQNGKSDDVKTVHQLGCIAHDSEPSALPKRMKYRRQPRRKDFGSIRRVRCTQSTLRQASIRGNKGPSLGKVQIKIPRQRSPYDMKFEHRSQEETERQERCAGGKEWNLARNI